MPVLFKDSYAAWKVATSSDAALLANILSRYTSAGGFLIDNTGGLSGRNELAIANGSVSKTLPHRSRWVVGFRYRYGGATLGNSFIYEAKNNDTPLFELKQNADGTIALIAGAGTSIGVSDRALLSQTRYFIEIDYSFSGTTPITCTAEVRINGHVEISGSASTGVNASSLLSSDATTNVHKLDGVSVGLGQTTWYTDLYIKDEAGYEGDVRNVPLYPASDGGISSWTPNSGIVHYNRVNTHPVDLTKWLSTATPGAFDLWGLDALPAFSGVIKGINIRVLAQKDDEGSKSFKIVVGPTGTDAQSDEFFVSSSNPEYYEFSLTVNPLTGLAFTQAEINAPYIIGVKCIS
jgi:hypothetical protein